MLSRVLAAGLLAGLWLSGCSHSSLPVLGPDDYVAPTNVPNLLRNLELAFRDRNLERYWALLHEEFLHVPDRRNEGPETPWLDEEWGREKEIDLIRSLFCGEPDPDGRIIEACKLDFSWGVPEQSSLDPDWVLVVLSRVEPVIDTVEETTGDEWKLQGRLHPWLLHLAQTEQRDPETGKGIWRIIRREETYTSETASWERLW